jgi:hypothetical protein
VTKAEHLQAAEQILEQVKANLDLFNGSPGIQAETKDVLHFDTMLRTAELHLKLAESLVQEPQTITFSEYTVLGPDTFIDRAENVIAYKGDNYYRRPVG